MASQNGHLEVVELLLKKGADVSICTKVRMISDSRVVSVCVIIVYKNLISS